MPVKKESKIKAAVTSSRAKRGLPEMLRISKQAGDLPRTGKIASSTRKSLRLSPPRNDKLSVPVYSMLGKETGTLDLPKEIFGVKVSKKLLAQAMRVYMTNQKSLSGFTRTRGEVEGSTAKMGAQKGSGHARHGSKRAPIFVGGGIVFGPKPRKVRLEMPKKMKKAALISALSSKLEDKNIIGISGIDKATGKTKEMVKLMESLKIKSGLIITDENTDSISRAVRNIKGINVLPASLLNSFEVLSHKFLLVTREGVEKLTK